MSVFSRYCCKSRLRLVASRDSILLTRISARSIHGGRLKSDESQFFYEFRRGDASPEDHLVRKIDAAPMSWLRDDLAPHYSSMGRPSVDPD
jgi:hypothetical protein